MVPRNSDDGGVPLKQVADNVKFHTAVQQKDSVLSIAINLLFTHAYLCHEVLQVGIVSFGFIFLKNQFSQHGPFFT